MEIPKQYLPIMPYIIVENAQSFLDFTVNVFDAKAQLIVPGEGERTIMHAEIRIGEAVIMFAGSNEQWGTKTSGMFIFVDNTDTVYQTALQFGAKSIMPPSHQDYGYSGGFEDPFGNQWWICTP